MDLKTLCLSFLSFINQHGDFQPVLECPPVVSASVEQLQQIACDGNACPAQAFYELEQQTIYLSEELNLEDIVKRSILVHELVHYIQDVSGEWVLDENECRASMKRELHAFRLQEMFLLAHNIHLPVSKNMMFYRC